jgi:hypothetical protein
MPDEPSPELGPEALALLDWFSTDPSELRRFYALLAELRNPNSQLGEKLLPKLPRKPVGLEPPSESKLTMAAAAGTGGLILRLGL